MPTKMMARTTKMLTYSAGLPTEIWSGGMKLNTNARSDPMKPAPPMIHIPVVPPGSR